MDSSDDPDNNRDMNEARNKRFRQKLRKERSKESPSAFISSIAVKSSTPDTFFDRVHVSDNQPHAADSNNTMRASTNEEVSNESEISIKHYNKVEKSKEFQEKIKRSFRKPKSAEVFDLLMKYGSLDMDELAALMGFTLTSFRPENHPLQELREGKYIEWHTRSRCRIYQLSDKAFLNPETDRRNRIDVSYEDEIAAVFGPKKIMVDREERLRHKETVNLEQNTRKKQRITPDDGTSSSYRNQTSTIVTSAQSDNAQQSAFPSNNRISAMISDQRSVTKSANPLNKSPNAIFQNTDIIWKIAEFFDSETLLFSVATLSKNIRFPISHVHAVCCAMVTEKGKRRMQQLRTLIQKGCIYTPSPLRILRLATGRRCEMCNLTRTNNVNDLGLFLCKECTLGITEQVEPYGVTKHVLVAALCNDACAKVVRGPDKYFMYSNKSPFLDRAGEKSGPLVSMSDMTAAAYCKTTPLTEFFDTIGADDLHRSKIPLIIESCKKFAQKIKRYHHLGIVNHKWDFHGANNSVWWVLVQWQNGERTWQPLNEFAKDDFESCASYAKEHNLLNKIGWKRFRSEEHSSF